MSNIDHLKKQIARSKLKMENSKLKIAVLTGGIGEERDISIQSGNCVMEALKEAGFDVITADITPDSLEALGDETIDVFFIALHGRFGEDGQLQQILEDKSLTYTGSGPEASRLAFDKSASKQRFTEAGVTTPRAIKFDNQTELRELERRLRQFSNKFVVKPLRQGSSVGVSAVDSSRQVLSRAKACFAEFGDCMIEEFIPGRDITVGVLCGQVLPIIELRTRAGFYDYHAKYVDEQTEFLFDTVGEPALTAKIQSATLACFNALGCRHFARIDFRLGNDGTVYALELNAIPGFTTRSDLPKAAAKAGISMSDLCVRIIEAAQESKILTAND